jgi:DNA-binding MarR family transcriptional regulator
MAVKKRKTGYQRRGLAQRQMQLLRVLDGEYGLTSKQIARRMNVTIPRARVYINSLLKSDLILVNFRAPGKNTKHLLNHYAIKRKA